MIVIQFEPKDDEGKPYYEVTALGCLVPTVKIRQGDGYAFTELATGLTVDVQVRKSPDEQPISSLDKLHDWLRDKGLEVSRSDALELMRIMNGWDGPKPESI